ATIRQVSQHEQEWRLAELRRVRYGYLLTLHVLLGVVNLFLPMRALGREVGVSAFLYFQAAMGSMVISCQVWKRVRNSCRYAGAANRCRRGRKCWSMGP